MLVEALFIGGGQSVIFKPSVCLFVKSCAEVGKVKSAYGPMWPTRPELIPVSVA